MSQLRVERLGRRFGGLVALANISLTVESGEKRAVIGPNGAGKSTLFDLISGELAPTQGRIYFEGHNLTRLPVYKRARLGLGRTFQRNNLFLGLTVSENLRLAIHHRLGLTQHLFSRWGQTQMVQPAVDSILAQVDLVEYRNQPAGNLAYGQQRVLELALALAGRPKLLLLDEPTAGMSPAETAEMIRLIDSLPSSLTILIVEHDMDVVFSLADHITVLHYGQIISQGRPDQVRANPRVQEIYLGVNGRG